MVFHDHSSGTNGCSLSLSVFSFYLTFQGLPNFIKSPEDQTGISGGVASFVCQAAGEPKPRITWMKKGKKVSSQRFEVTNCLSLPLLSMSVSLPCHLIIMPFFFPSSVVCATLLFFFLRWYILLCWRQLPSVLSLRSLCPRSCCLCVVVWAEIWSECTSVWFGVSMEHHYFFYREQCCRKIAQLILHVFCISFYYMLLICLLTSKKSMRTLSKKKQHLTHFRVNNKWINIVKCFCLFLMFQNGTFESKIALKKKTHDEIKPMSSTVVTISTMDRRGSSRRITQDSTCWKFRGKWLKTHRSLKIYDLSEGLSEI